MAAVSQELIALVLRHAKSGPLPVPRLGIATAQQKTERIPGIYEPLLYFVLQGRKWVSMGDRVLEYEGGSLMVASLDLPVMWQVRGASKQAPYVAVSLELDRPTVASLLLDLPPQPEDRPEGMIVGAQPPRVLEALTRLVSLLESPTDISVLAPLYERELLYLVLQSPQGRSVREFARRGGHLSKISRAVAWIRRHALKPLDVEALRDIAGMSRTSLFREFKHVTGMSPLAFQKALRLQEARYRLLATPGDVAGVAFSVGYESASQFSREYARQFGAPPSKDIDRLIASGPSNPALRAASARRSGVNP